MIKSVEKLFLRVIDPWGKYARLYETKDKFITNTDWAVKKEVLKRYNLPYQDFIINKLKNREVKKLFNEIVEKGKVAKEEVFFALSKQVWVENKKKSVYYFYDRELRDISILKIYADFLCALCSSNPKLYVIKNEQLEAYFVWFEKDKLIAMCAGIIENQ